MTGNLKNFAKFFELNKAEAYRQQGDDRDHPARLKPPDPIFPTFFFLENQSMLKHGGRKTVDSLFLHFAQPSTGERPIESPPLHTSPYLRPCLDWR